jgi:hypothetical protein
MTADLRVVIQTGNPAISVVEVTVDGTLVAIVAGKDILDAANAIRAATFSVNKKRPAPPEGRGSVQTRQ